MTDLPLGKKPQEAQEAHELSSLVPLVLFVVPPLL